MRGAARVATAALLAPWAIRDTMIRPGAWAWPQTMSHEGIVPPLFRTRDSRGVQRSGRACPVFAVRQKVDTLGIEPRASRMLSGCDTTTPHALDKEALAKRYPGARSGMSQLPWRLTPPLLAVGSEISLSQVNLDPEICPFRYSLAG